MYLVYDYDFLSFFSTLIRLCRPNVVLLSLCVCQCQYWQVMLHGNEDTAVMLEP